MCRDVLDIEGLAEYVDENWGMFTISQHLYFAREIVNELIQRHEADPRSTKGELEFLYQERAKLTEIKLGIDRA